VMLLTLKRADHLCLPWTMTVLLPLNRKAHKRQLLHDYIILSCIYVNVQNSTSVYTLWTVYRCYLNDISPNIELQLYNIMRC
jgi:hypothetical protein